MKLPLPVVRYGASLVVAVSLLLVVVPLLRAQRPAPKPAPANTNATRQTPAAAAEQEAPSVTFDTLLSADAYGIYAEMRMIGRHANSQEIAQLITPFNLEGGSAQDEVMALYEFVRSHAEALTTARMMFAAMPARAGLPETLVAVEMPSVEEARKFVPELRQFIAAQMAPPAATPTTTVTTNASLETSNTTRRRRNRSRERGMTENAGIGVRAKRPAVPQFQIKRTGSLIAMSGANFTFKNLHGTNQALLVNEPGFQAARTRFSTDTLFVYFNTVRMTRSSKQQAEALEKEYRRQEKLAQAETRKPGPQSNSNLMTENDKDVAVVVDDGVNANVADTSVGSTGNMNVSISPEDEAVPPSPTPEATPAPMSEKELEEERRREQSERFVQTLGGLVFSGRADSSESWPESIGVGASLEADSLVLRGLFVSPSAEQPVRPIPFLPVLLSGPSIAAEAPMVLPADTEIFLSVSLDLPQMYDYLASMMKIVDLAPVREDGKGGFGEQLSTFEKTNNFRIREELLAALGNEIAVGIPGSQFFGTGGAPRNADDPSTPPPPSGPIVVVALNDKEGLQKLLPRVLNAVGFAGATEQSIIEKHGQVEVLNFSNGTLAFIDRFLVGTPDAATMRRVTDAYNSGATLANNERFRDSTSWQSRQAIGQVYIASAMIKSRFAEVTASIDDIEDPALRAYLTGLDPEPGAITHLATRESDGLMHELRLPKNLLSLFTAGALVSQKLAVMRTNEFTVQWKLRSIYNAQNLHKEKTGRYGTLEELLAAGHVNDDLHPSGDIDRNKAQVESDGYEIKVSVSGDSFQATATPTGYPKLGRRSYYIDQTGSLRGGDTGGKPASESNPIIE